MNKSDTIGNLAAALSIVQANLKGAMKDSDNPYYKSRYADLASVWDACREPLAANGFAVIQATSSDNGAVVVETILAHKSNEWISGTLRMKPVKDEPQAVGSAITYARRYALAAIVGICPEDDDAEAAHGRTHAPTKQNVSSRSKQPELKPLPNSEDAKTDLEKLKTLLGPNIAKAEMYLRDFTNAKGQVCNWLLPTEGIEDLNPERVKLLLQSFKEFSAKLEEFIRSLQTAESTPTTTV